MHLSHLLSCKHIFRIPVIPLSEPLRMVILYEGSKLTGPVDVYKQDVEFEVPKALNLKFEKYDSQFMDALGNSAFERMKKIETKTRSVLREFLTLKDIRRLKLALKDILHKSPIDHRLSGAEWSTVMTALHFLQRTV
ncbi:hypothetical protein GQ457_04G037900 [Hibiscus cannabinus]